ncbi:hypothetical protein NA57DRAFT_55726 [Rhizodiscina lignyota]|uniref:Cytochrome P450 n=1 Tax=Rhizodiscina lignyota TaxID=1504668 RepID=A0A9P4IIA5_9PEZI|nr:hypothetical protein NA57DRAFT_55726 [Rhizodiscina lignyota]
MANPSLGIRSEECLEIIATENCKGEKVNKLNRFESRARPNARLISAFGINNSFTTTDQSRASSFRGQIAGIVTIPFQTTEKGEKLVLGWIDLVEKARGVIQRELNGAKQSHSLVDVLQMTTMKMSLQVLFGIDAEDLDRDRDIRALASWVNEQWIRSKYFEDGSIEDPWHFSNQHDIHDLLRHISPVLLSDLGDNPDNPLNRILPGYETLWRIVLRCLVEVASNRHSIEDRRLWQTILQRFAENPSIVPLDKKDQGISAGIIASEALRLYPPYRHIYRTYEVGTQQFERIAGVEECHRSDPRWGPDPTKFLPSRWASLPDLTETQAMNDYFLAFGAAPFQCPAATRIPNTDKSSLDKTYLPFSISMIALLVGLFTKEMSNKWKLTGSAELESASEPLTASRRDYKDLIFEKI